MKYGYYTYDELIHETESAWLLSFDGEEIWFAKSECAIDENEKNIEVPEWLAIEKGLE